jgi:splicing factor 3A subunit 1
VIDPITKKSVRIDDMTEHMRIQLLDPKWAAEKAKFLENQKDSNLVDGDAIARNMETFAKARTDLFGASVSLYSMKLKTVEFDFDHMYLIICTCICIRLFLGS